METSFPLNIELFKYINASGNANEVMVFLAKGLAVYAPFPVIAILVWFWVRKTAEARRSLMIAGIALGLGLAVNFTLAFLYYIPRPFEIGVGRALLSHGPETSFPSDHATFLWSLGFGLLMTRPLRLPGGAIACLGSSVAWARVYLGVHFPLDMAASLVIAACAALVARGLSSRLDGNLFSTVERMNTHILNIVARRKNAGDVG